MDKSNVCEMRDCENSVSGPNRRVCLDCLKKTQLFCAECGLIKDKNQFTKFGDHGAYYYNMCRMCHMATDTKIRAKRQASKTEKPIRILKKLRNTYKHLEVSADNVQDLILDEKCHELDAVYSDILAAMDLISAQSYDLCGIELKMPCKVDF